MREDRLLNARCERAERKKPPETENHVYFRSQNSDACISMSRDDGNQVLAQIASGTRGGSCLTNLQAVGGRVGGTDMSRNEC